MIFNQYLKENYYIFLETSFSISFKLNGSIKLLPRKFTENMLKITKFVLICFLKNLKQIETNKVATAGNIIIIDEVSYQKQIN